MHSVYAQTPIYLLWIINGWSVGNFRGCRLILSHLLLSRAFFIAWIFDNKLTTLLGVCLFAFVIATICLAAEKNSLQDQLEAAKRPPGNNNFHRFFCHVEWIRKIS